MKNAEEREHIPTEGASQ